MDHGCCNDDVISGDRTDGSPVDGVTLELNMGTHPGEQTALALGT